MKSWFAIAIICAVVTISAPTPSQAQCFESFENFGNCLSGKPATGEGMPLDDRLMTITHSTKNKMNTDDMYSVTVTCNVGSFKTNVDWNPFLSKNLATSHIVALTNTRLSQQDLPSNARANITVFSVSGDDKSRKVFLNKNCKTEFLVSGREQIFLAATANQVTTNAPGPFTRLVFEAIQVAIPILPLIQNTALTSTMLGDISKTQDPLNKMFAELDRGRTYTKSDDIFLGHNRIFTPYSAVDVYVSKVKSVLDPGNKDFLKIYEDATDAAEPALALSGAATPSQKCGEFANGLRSRNFSPPDIAYALILISQAANLTKINTLDCLGSRYALTALAQNENRAWDRYNGKSYLEADAKSHFAEQGGAIVLQPKFENWSDKLQIAVTLLGGDLQSQGTKSQNIAAYFSSSIHVDNLTTYFSDNLGESDLKLNELLSSLVDKKFQRAGCMSSDTEALAAFMILRSTKKDQNQFKDTDAVVMRVWYNDNQLISRVKLQYDVGLVEKALTARQSRVCGEDLEVLPQGK
jgi:hypothetical protein